MNMYEHVVVIYFFLRYYLTRYHTVSVFCNEIDTAVIPPGLCTSQASVQRLRLHKSHIHFLSKWNLAVYFQIRFQEIAGTFETALLEGWNHSDDGESEVLRGRRWNECTVHYTVQFCTIRRQTE